jgi:hypothetical protein
VVTNGSYPPTTSTPLLESANPALVPLETLLGRDDARFPAVEEPPWRNRIELPGFAGIAFKPGFHA